MKKRLDTSFSNKLPDICMLHSIKSKVVVLTYDACDQTQKNSGCDKDPVPVVRPSDCCDTKKDKDQRLTDAAPHFQEVLDGGVGLVRYVSLHIRSHHSSARD